MQTISGILHTGFTVRNLKCSLGFYVGLLGLEVVHTQIGDNAYTRKLVGIDDAKLSVALLRMPGAGAGHILELIEYLQPAGAEVSARPCDAGASHIAFATDDCRGLYERLSREGVRFISTPVAIEEGINKGGYACYLRDPDDFILEFLQLPASSRT